MKEIIKKNKKIKKIKASIFFNFLIFLSISFIFN